MACQNSGEDATRGDRMPPCSSVRACKFCSSARVGTKMGQMGAKVTGDAPIGANTLEPRYNASPDNDSS